MTKPPTPIDAEKLASFLASEAEKEPPADRAPASVYELFKANFGTIDKLLKVRRLTRKEVCDLLATQGIGIGLGTFNTYYTRAAKELGSGRSANKVGTVRKQRSDVPATTHGTGSKPDANKIETPARLAGTSAQPASTGSKPKALGGFGNRFADDEN